MSCIIYIYIYIYVYIYIYSIYVCLVDNGDVCSRV